MKNGVYISRKEAVLLGLPLRYGDIVDGKFFLAYEMSRATGYIGTRFKEPNWAENQRATRMRKRRKVKRFTQRVKMMYGCNNCGYKSNELNWMCPSCNTWETMTPKSAVDIIEDGGCSE